MSYKLDPVQEAARTAAKGRHGFGYWMEMGLGKSLTVLDEFREEVSNGVTRLVVICPNSFKSGWAEEIDKQGLDVDAHVFQSGSQFSNQFFRLPYNKPPVLIVNYEAIRSEVTFRTIWNWMATKPTYIAFDESIQIKTHDSIQTRAAIALSRGGRIRRILSGKPQTEGPHNLWGQMRAIGQFDGRNYYSFRAMFCRMGGFKNKQVIGVQNEDILAQMIEPHVFRAAKNDWGLRVAKLPVVREYEMSSEQRKQYLAMEHEFVLWLTEYKYVTVEAAITKYVKLAQIQCGFIIDTDDESRVHVICPPDKNPRVKLLKELLENEVVGKTIVVYVNQYAFHILNEALGEYNPAWIKGKMEPDELTEQKRRFNEDSSCRVILAQAKAGRYGHTLLGGPEPRNRCSTTIFFQNSYSLDDRSQIEDRNHRRGQTADSVVYIDLCGTSLDRRVINALQRKEAIFQRVFQHIKKEMPS